MNGPGRIVASKPVGGRKPIQHPPGRVCETPTCTVILSRYNAEDRCHQHAPRADDTRPVTWFSGCCIGGYRLVSSRTDRHERKHPSPLPFPVSIQVYDDGDCNAGC